MILGITMLGYSWKICQQQIAAAHVNPVAACMLPGMGALFVLGGLLGIVRTRG